MAEKPRTSATRLVTQTIEGLVSVCSAHPSSGRRHTGSGQTRPNKAKHHLSQLDGVAMLQLMGSARCHAHTADPGSVGAQIGNFLTLGAVRDRLTDCLLRIYHSIDRVVFLSTA